MRASLVLATILVGTALVASGCLDDSLANNTEKNKARLGKGGDQGALAFANEWAEIAVQGGETHDHRNILEHVGRSTPNFEFIAHNPLITDYHGKTAGGYFCGDVRESKEGRRLSVVHSWVSDVAFIISDVTDPKDPKKLGEFVMSNTHVYDLALTDDQKTVLLATSPGTNSIGTDPSQDDAQPVALFRDACTGEEKVVQGPEQGIPFASGIIVVDVTNPRTPAIQDFRFFPVNGGHSVQTREINGKQMLLISVPNGGLPVPVPGGVVPLPSGANSYYVIAELIESQAGRKINVLSVYNYAARPGVVPGQKIYGSMHDGFLHKHPITGKWYGYLAYGSSGLVIIDITDPTKPTFVGHWEDWSKFGKAAPGTPFVHEALPMDVLWDGKHYTFIGEECGGRRAETPTCLIVAIDTTDPSKPTFVSGWTLPAETGGWSGAMYSPHYLAVVNRTLFITMYHAGVWAVDVSTEENLRKMPSIGVYLPDKQSPKPIGRRVPYDFGPVVLDVLPLSDGSMIVYDGMTGLYTVRFDATNPAPSPEPWPLNYEQS